MPLHILDIIELGCQWVVDVDHDDLPVGLFLVEQSHDAKNLNLLNLTSVADQLANFADIEWVIITLGFGLRVDDVGIFPCLKIDLSDAVKTHQIKPYLWESTVVPEIALVREAVPNEAKLALLDVLLDRVQFLLF